MLQTCVFWALLWLPGLAFVRAFAASELERGLLSAVALGYAATFCLLSPVSLLCYALGLPVWVLSAATALSIALGFAVLLRGSAWRTLGTLWAREPRVPVLISIVLLALAERAGGWLDGDATFHIGRIRDLLDHGFSNHDIYLAQPYFAYAYHTNLLHALYAVAIQLTRQDPLLLWFATLGWAKLVIAGGHYHLAHVLSRDARAAWLVAIAASVATAGETYAVYPNLLAVGWLLPLVLAAGFAAHEADALRQRCVLSLALLSLVLVEVHPLYWAFTIVGLAPLLGLRAVVALRSDRRRAGFLATCLCALLAGAPSALVARYAGQPSAARTQAALAAASRLPTLPAAAPATPPAPSVSVHGVDADERSTPRPGGGHLEKQLVRRADGQRALPLSNTGGLAFLLLGMLALAFDLWRPELLRPRIVASSAALVPYLAVPLVPALCTWAVTLGFPEFGVARMITPASSLLFVAIGMALTTLIARFAPRAVFHDAALCGSVVAASLLPAQAPRSFAEYVSNAIAPEAQRHNLLDQQRARRSLLEAFVPAGETVLATLRDARYVVMLRDVRVVAADRGHGHVPDLELRRQHVELMTQGRLAWPLRAELLRHYGIHFAVYRDKHRGRFAWALHHGVVVGQAGGWNLVRLEDRQPAPAPQVL